MSLLSLLSPILYDEHLTRGLGDAEARMLVEWLVARTERGHEQHASDELTRGEVERLRRRARALGRFVALWSQHDHAAAIQLAATQRFPWPLPTGPVDPCDLMSDILFWETDSDDASDVDRFS